MIGSYFMGANESEPAELEKLWPREHRTGSRRASSFLFWLILLFAQPFMRISALNSDGHALLAFKYAVNDPTFALRAWNPADASPCNWTGIICSENSEVTSISLTRKNLVGIIPPEIGNLSQLRRVNLHSNALQGPLPQELFKPQFLRAVFLFKNNITGSLSPNVGRLANLQRLDLSNNAIEGAIPADIVNNRKLVILALSNNRFSGPIPIGIGTNLTFLQRLDLNSNQLSGTVPSDFGSLSSLQGTLNLSNNHFTGSIPASLGNLPLGITFDFSNNNFSGSIPRDGTFSRQGRNSFLGNPLLCGAPTSNECVPSPVAAPTPHETGSSPAVGKGKRVLSFGVIMAIAFGGAAAILIPGIIYAVLFLKHFQKHPADHGKGEERGPNESSSVGSPKKSAASNFCCFPAPPNDSEVLDKVGPGELVPLSGDLNFDLEELLRASAYVLGVGGKGIVYKAILQDGFAVAVRRLGEGGALHFKDFEVEVLTVGRLRHPNIVTLRAYYWAFDEKLLLYDFMPNGNLAAALHESKSSSTLKRPLNWAARLKIALGAARGLAFIHGYTKDNLVHREIRTSNIFLDAKMDARIAEYGLDRLISLARDNSPQNNDANLASGSMFTSAHLEPHTALQSSNPKTSGQPVNPANCYYPPEAAEHEIPTQKWDVFSFGMVLLELLSGKSPATHLTTSEPDLPTWFQKCFDENRPSSDMIDSYLLPEISSSESEMREVVQIAMKCISPDPEQRPEMQEVSNLFDLIGKVRKSARARGRLGTTV